MEETSIPYESSELTDALIEMEIDMTASHIAPLADAYAMLKAQFDDLKDRVENARKEILETGATEIVGEYYTVTVGSRKGSNKFDKDAAIALLKQLGANAEQIDALYSQDPPCAVLRYKASLAAAA